MFMVLHNISFEKIGLCQQRSFYTSMSAKMYAILVFILRTKDCGTQRAFLFASGHFFLV